MRRARNLRRLVLAALLVLLAAGVSGLLGERRGTAAASADGYELVVDYQARTRGGLSGDVVITVRRDGGFDGPVTLAVSADYLRLLDQPALQPQPSSASASEGWVLWEFPPPPGDTLRVVYDARVESGAHRGRRGTVAVVDRGRTAVSVDLRTRVMP